MMIEFQNGDLVELVDDISRHDRDYSLDGEDYKKGHRFVIHSTGPMSEFEIDRYGVGSYWVYIGSPQWGWVSNTRLRIVNRAIAKLEKSMAVGHSGTSRDNVPKTQPSELSEKRKERTMRTMRTVVTGESGETPGESFPPELSANPEINPFEE